MADELRNIYYDGLNDGVVGQSTIVIPTVAYTEGVAPVSYDYITFGPTPRASLNWPTPAMFYLPTNLFVDVPARGLFRWEIHTLALTSVEPARRGIFVGSADLQNGYVIEHEHQLLYHVTVQRVTGGVFTQLHDAGACSFINTWGYILYANCDSVPHSIEGGAEILAPGCVSMWLQMNAAAPTPMWNGAATAEFLAAVNNGVFGWYVRTTSAAGNITGNVSFYTVPDPQSSKVTSLRWRELFDNGVVDESTEPGAYTAIAEGGGQQSFTVVNGVRANMGWDLCPIAYDNFAALVDLAGGLFRAVLGLTVPALDDIASGLFITNQATRDNGYLLEIQRTAGPIYTLKAFRVAAGVLTEVASVVTTASAHQLAIYLNKTLNARPTQNGELLLAVNEVGFAYLQTAASPNPYHDIGLYQELDTVLTDFPNYRIGWYVRATTAGANINTVLQFQDVVLTQDIADLDAPYFANIDPTDGESWVSVTETLKFDVLDDGFGVDPAQTTVIVDGVIVWTGDAPVGPYSGSRAAIANGFRYTLSHPAWTKEVYYTVNLHIEDFAGLVANTTYTFRTEEIVRPYVPDPLEETGVAFAVPLQFKEDCKLLLVDELTAIKNGMMLSVLVRKRNVPLRLTLGSNVTEFEQTDGIGTEIVRADILDAIKSGEDRATVIGTRVLVTNEKENVLLAYYVKRRNENRQTLALQVPTGS